MCVHVCVYVICVNQCVRVCMCACECVRVCMCVCWCGVCRMGGIEGEGGEGVPVEFNNMCTYCKQPAPSEVHRLISLGQSLLPG